LPYIPHDDPVRRRFNQRPELEFGHFAGGKLRRQLFIDGFKFRSSPSNPLLEIFVETNSLIRIVLEAGFRRLSPFEIVVFR
jgi:hypothetical protein